VHICLIITSFTSGGAEVLVCNLAQAFLAAGHEATVVALSHAAQVGNDPGVERVMMEQVTAAGGKARSLGLRNRNNVIGGMIAMRRVFREGAPDIVHVHTARALPILALARPAAPIVLTHHNSRLSFPPRAYKLFDRLVSSYVAISDQCAAQTRDLARRPVRTILNAASPRFQATAPREAPARDPIVLAVGTISTQKDYPTLIRAARPLAEKLAGDGRTLRIRIAGGGQTIDSLHELVRTEGVGDIVELLGSRSDVEQLMREADVFANCSLWEGFSIAMIEASMSGLPTVATDVAGNCEMVIPDLNGELVPHSDPVALAGGIAAVLDDDRRYGQLSRGALEAAKRFSIENCAEGHLALYRDVMPRSGVPSLTQARASAD
jgi:glycosyltransferase involved in cell wall biosynthesis